MNKCIFLNPIYLLRPEFLKNSLLNEGLDIPINNLLMKAKIGPEPEQSVQDLFLSDLGLGW